MNGTREFAGDLADRLRGMMVGAAVGDRVRHVPGPARMSLRRPGSRGQSAAVSAALAVLGCPGDAAGAARLIGTGHPLRRRPDAARAVVPAVVFGAFHAENPWLRYRFALASAGVTLAMDGFDVAAAAAAQLCAIAGSLSVSGACDTAAGRAALDPMAALAGTGLVDGSPRDGAPKPMSRAAALEAAERWKVTALHMVHASRSRTGVANLARVLSWSGDTDPGAYGDAPISVLAWMGDGGDVAEAAVQARTHAATWAAPVTAAMLAGASAGRSRIPDRLLRAADAGPFGVRALDRLGTLMAEAAMDGNPRAVPGSMLGRARALAPARVAAATLRGTLGPLLARTPAGVHPAAPHQDP